MTHPITELVASKLKGSFGGSAGLASLEPLAGDASSRRYYRARLSGPNIPPSIIVMEIPAGGALPLSSEELAIFKEGPRELPFLNLHRFLESIGVRVPRLYGQWEDLGILFLEDLGDTALWDRVQGLGAAETLAWYQTAIDELLALQVRGTRARSDDCIAFQQRFDAKLYLWEFEHFIEWGLLKRPGAKPAEPIVERLRAGFREIAELLDRQPPCLNHRDYHSWNLMVRDGAVFVIDFQDALLAPPQYDLASLLNDRITDSVIDAELEEKLLCYYMERRRDLEPSIIDIGEFWEIYRLSAIQRDLKVIGRFYYLDLVKGKPAYRKFIPPTVRRLRRNLVRSERTRNFLPLLDEHFEAML